MICGFRNVSGNRVVYSFKYRFIFFAKDLRFLINKVIYGGFEGN